MLTICLFSCNKNNNGEVPTLVDQVTAVTEDIDGFEALAKGFDIPWAVEVIGEREYLVTERFGTLYHYNNGAITALDKIPRVKTVSDGSLSYGGLMDVCLHPQFENNRLVYITYVGTNYTMKVARFTFQGDIVQNLSVIFETDAFSIGSRIAWQDNDHFFVSQGSGGNPFPEPGGQDLRSDVGKIHRLMKDGSIPEDNPILEGMTRPSSIWSYGHRDPQGLYFDTDHNTLYSNEHGPLGGDELNIINKGGNYGWPMFSHGKNYDGSAVSNMTQAEAGQISELPIKTWSPSIAPSCLMEPKSSNFAELNGEFLMGALSQDGIIRYNPTSGISRMAWTGVGRVRDIVELPSGDLLAVIDKNSPKSGLPGRLIRLKR